MLYERARELLLLKKKNKENVDKKARLMPKNMRAYIKKDRIRGLRYAIYIREFIFYKENTCTTFYELYDRPIGEGGHLILFDKHVIPVWRSYYK